METFAEKLYIALHTLLPEDWDKLVFRGILAPGSCEFYFWWGLILLLHMYTFTNDFGVRICLSLKM